MGCSASRRLPVAPTAGRAAGAASAAAGAEVPLDVVMQRLELAYGKPTDQIGSTDGHECVTVADTEEALRCGASLLYGEVLSTGVAKLLAPQHLDAAHASCLYDLGMGIGKLCLQAFLQYTNLKFVYGVELAYSRYNIAEAAVLALCGHGGGLKLLFCKPGEVVRAQTLRAPHREIELRRGDMWRLAGIEAADIVVLHTQFPMIAINKFRSLAHRLRPGARIVTYQNVASVWKDSTVSPLQALETPAAHGSRGASESKEAHDNTVQFTTSWSSSIGHPLFLWQRVAGPQPARASCMSESKEGFESYPPA